MHPHEECAPVFPFGCDESAAFLHQALFWIGSPTTLFYVDGTFTYIRWDGIGWDGMTWVFYFVFVLNNLGWYDAEFEIDKLEQMSLKT